MMLIRGQGSFSLVIQCMPETMAKVPYWLPGLVVGFEGSAVYRVCLKDSRVVRQHGDQLRFRAAGCETDSLAIDGLLEDIPNPCTGVEASTGEPETAVMEQNSSQTAPQTTWSMLTAP